MKKVINWIVQFIEILSELIFWLFLIIVIFLEICYFLYLIGAVEQLSMLLDLLPFIPM